jgi:C-terminal processing protease CtpA/Prc
MTLYRDAGGTLPHVAADVRSPEPDKPAGFVPSGNDRATRLAAVALGWTVFEHFYPYFDIVQVDWPGELRKALAEAAKLPGEVNFLNTLRGMVAALQDGHGSVTHPSKVFTHQLPLAWHWVEDKLVVSHADPRAPGIARGDVIVGINGRATLQAIANEEKLVAASTPQHRRWRTLQRMLRGSPNETVRLKVQRARGGTANLVLRRTALFPLAEPKPEKITEIRPGIFYVDLDRISTQDFRDALGQLAAARGIIFDLRGYPNNVSVLPLHHLAGQTLRSAIFNTPLITRPSREGIRFEDGGWTIPPAPSPLRAKTAFITDGRAVSYAETYMGIVEAFRLAEIVGGPTAGTNGNVNPFVLPGGYTVFWTGMQVLKHDGSRHHGVGIQPTVPVSRTLQGVAAGRDELLEKAIEVVSP